MCTADPKDPFREMLFSFRERLACLPPSSRLLAALGDELLEALAGKIERSAVRDLEFGPWPPIIGWLHTMDDGAVAALDRDLDLVVRHVGPAPANQIRQFLSATTARESYAALFDTWAKATLIRSGLPTETDVPIHTGGRVSDLRVRMDARAIRLECTVLTEDNESCDVWRRFIEVKKTDPQAILWRPGPYCPPDAKGPSPYYNARRLYAKVYDKLARELDPEAGQCAENEPNVLLISCAGPGIWPDIPGINWALEELSIAQPRGPSGGSGSESHCADISLPAWIDHHAQTLISKGRLTDDDYAARYDRLLAAPRRLGGIILFKNFRWATGRVNYNAFPQCAIRHAEMVELERLLGREPAYAF